MAGSFRTLPRRPDLRAARRVARPAPAPHSYAVTVVRADRAQLPDVFARAIETLRRARPRAEVQLTEVAPPQRLAPYTFALSARVLRGADELATGRLVLLHDPAGQDAWDGTLRIVTYVTAELDAEMAGDPLLAEVGWSWLMDALSAHDAGHTAAGGTVTQTRSVRFGDLAGPSETADIELRASWTPVDVDLTEHLLAWCELLCSTAGLPPPGVTLLAESGG